jgi:glycosyltransferase involved in cell wall biosynthesis
MTARHPDVVVLIPALNEEAGLANVLGALPAVAAVIVVDNGSTDRTAEVARAAGALVVSEPRRGYGSACLAGLAALDRLLEPSADRMLAVETEADGEGGLGSLPHRVEDVPIGNPPPLRGRAGWGVIDSANADSTADSRDGDTTMSPESDPSVGGVDTDDPILVFLDADFSDDPAELPNLVEPIRRGEAELVIGSRALGRREPGSMPLHSMEGNRVVCWLVSRLFRIPCTDLGPFRAIRRRTLARLGMTDRDFGWTIEMQIRAARAGLAVVEVPVRYRRRIGRSKISGTIVGSVRAGFKILWTLARHALASRP